MNTFIRFIIIFCIFALLGLFIYLMKRIDLPKKERAYQFPMIIVAFLYALIITFTFQQILTLVERFVGFVARWIPLVEEIFPYMSAAFMLIGNLLILILFIIIKQILKGPLSRLWKKHPAIANFTSSIAYEYDEDKRQWVLQLKFGYLRRVFNWMFICAIILSGGYFLYVMLVSMKGIFSLPFYPMIGLIFFSEVISFLQGMLKEEIVQVIDGDDEVSEEVINFAKLRIIFKKMFPEFILKDGCKEKGLSHKDNSNEYIEKLLTSMHHEERLCGAYFAGLIKRNIRVDSQYINATLDIIHHKSVLFSTPFYRDLTQYLFFALNRSIMSKEKVLIIIGRDAICEDVMQWIEEGIIQVSRLPFLWKSAILNNDTQDIDIGILSFSQIFDLELHEKNREFFQEVSHVVLLEPSRIVATAQTALYMLTSYLKPNTQYCIFDKNSDGLVDSLSHILKTNITEVSATKFGARSSQMIMWNADGKPMHHKLFSGITRYLGSGSEIAMVSLKHGIKDIDWYSYDRFPIVDMKWILGQYYAILCDYAGLPSKQHRLNDYIHFNNNLWAAKIKKESCVVVEDEYNNLYEMARQFSTRGEQQSFIHVLSGNYLLRDYMHANSQIFLNDPKAIPAFTPDFARTPRNIILEIIMRISIAPVALDEIKEQLSHTFGNIEDIPEFLCQQLHRYFIVDDKYHDERFIKVQDRELFDDKKISEYTIKEIYIDNHQFIDTYLLDLRNANYVAEDEITQHFLGAKLLGQVYQKYLPRQFMTISGKYYEIISIDPKNGVILRRASDHIHERQYYRQIREYSIDQCNSPQSSYIHNNIHIASFQNNIHVKTCGYYQLHRYDDIKNAKEVILEDIPERNYVEKTMLKINFPDITAEQRITLTTLLNELFLSIYPDNYEYLCAVTYLDDTQKESMKGILHAIQGEIEEDAIYIIEDSQLDLGLMISVERNLERFLEIVCDFLDWHLQAIKPIQVPIQESHPEPLPQPQGTLDTPSKKLWHRIKNWFARRWIIKLLKRIWNAIFKRKKKANIKANLQDDIQSENVEDTIHDAPVNETIEPIIDDASTESMEPTVEEPRNDEPESQIDEQQVEEPTEDDAIVDVGGKDEEVIQVREELPAYASNYFMLYGDELLKEWFNLEDTYAYLKKLNYGDNNLKKARDQINEAIDIEQNYDPTRSDIHFCDFCGRELTGLDYDILSDGRERCPQCRQTAVKTIKEFKNIYEVAIQNYEAYFGVKFNVSIHLEMTDSITLHKKLGKRFVPTSGSDPRVLGVAIKDRNGDYKIYVENGAPRDAFVSTLVHELTHIWQFTHWNEIEIINKYGKNMNLEVYEGMAKWVEIQYMMYINEYAFAKREEIITRNRNDEYGRGFNFYVSKYPLRDSIKPNSPTPFDHIDEPL